MKILFIKLKNIGDALIMTPALTVAREIWPGAQIDVLVREGCEGILKGSLALTNIYETAAPEKNKRQGQLIKDLKLLYKLRKEKYDWIFELGDNDRGRVMAIFIGAKNLAAHSHYKFPFWARPYFNKLSDFAYHEVHRCEKDVELLRAFGGYLGATPPMQYDRSFADWSWVQNNITTAPIVVHAVTRWKRKMWPMDKWKALVAKLAEHAPVVLTSGNNPAEISLARQIALVNPARISVTAGELDWPQMAGLLYSARMLVTVDTATMHLGAACGVPMVALFGPSLEKHWSPWACEHQLVVAPAVASGKPEERQIADIGLEEVWARCQKVLADVAIRNVL